MNTPMPNLDELSHILEKHRLMVEETKRRYDEPLVLNGSCYKIIHSNNHNPCGTISGNIIGKMELVVYKYGGKRIMDIFEYAKEYDADYYEMQTGNIYHVQEYNRAKRLGLPTPVDGIRVSRDGETIGVVREHKKEV